ncbi:MAG: hypothetical protein AB7O62_18875 [Pirellulales bacterium]
MSYAARPAWRGWFGKVNLGKVNLGKVNLGKVNLGKVNLRDGPTAIIPRKNPARGRSQTVPQLTRKNIGGKRRKGDRDVGNMGTMAGG